jgi:hypothetical protein
MKVTVRAEVLSERTWETVEVDAWEFEAEETNDQLAQANAMGAAALATMGGPLNHYFTHPGVPPGRAAISVTIAHADIDAPTATVIFRPRAPAARRVKRKGQKAPA